MQASSLIGAEPPALLAGTLNNIEAVVNLTAWPEQ